MENENKKKNYFEELYAIDVKDKIEKKGDLNYLSWAWAWAELKKRHPTAKKDVVKNEQGWLYHTDGKTCWVEVSVTIDDITETEYLPVLDYKNQPIPLDKINSMNVNTSLQRAITKAIGRHGLGLYIYAGEDLPEEAKEDEVREKAMNWVGNYLKELHACRDDDDLILLQAKHGNALKRLRKHYEDLGLQIEEQTKLKRETWVDKSEES